jgi:hypothetical protein
LQQFVEIIFYNKIVVRIDTANNNGIYFITIKWITDKYHIVRTVSNFSRHLISQKKYI